jgi:hypothetical protein
MEFYTAETAKAGKVGGAGCMMGALAGAILGSIGGFGGSATLAAKGCGVLGFGSGLIRVIEAPFKHWSKAAQAAYRARKAYRLSFAWLDADAFELAGRSEATVQSIVEKKVRKCALRYHPDKLPPGSTQKHRENAATRLANCLFARAYILAFQRKYGNLDPEDDGPGARQFLEEFAGSWAAALGTNDGPGSMSLHQIDEWMNAVKHHTEL